MTTQGAQPASDGRPAPVLLVEQHPLMRELLEHILDSRLGLRVSACADSGKTAIGAATDLEPQLVLMDFDLTDMDGLQATHAILHVLPAALVVLLIDAPDEGYSAAALASGAAVCIEKTLIWTELPAAMARLLDEVAHQGTREEE